MHLEVRIAGTIPTSRCMKSRVITLPVLASSQFACYCSNRRRARRSELVPPSLDKKRSVTTMRSGGGEHLMVDKCGDCGVVLEAYDEETISLCIVCLATFIHREPSLSAPLLLNMLQSVTRLALEFCSEKQLQTKCNCFCIFNPYLLCNADSIYYNICYFICRIAASTTYPWQTDM